MEEGDIFELRIRRRTKKRKQSVPEALPQAPSAPFALCAAESPELRVASACTGWATESQALTRLGVSHRVLFTCDNDPNVRHFLRQNVVYSRLHHDVHHAAFQAEETTDIFVAGCPCQPYSTEGLGLAEQGPRSHVESAVLAYVRQAKPKCIILENVVAWKRSKRFQEAMQILQAVTNDAGSNYYNVYCKVMDTAELGTPQARRRLYVVALAAHLDRGFTFPASVGHHGGLSGILDAGSDVSKRCCSVEDLTEEATSTATAVDSIVNAYAGLTEEEASKHVVVDLGAGRGKRYTVDGLPTLTANRCSNQAYYSLNMRRRLSMHELARAQGVCGPENFNLQGIRRSAYGTMIGNAMSVNVMMQLILQVVTCTALL